MAQVSRAETWTLMPRLTFTPSEKLDVTFQSSKDIGIDGDHIWGWKGEEAEFFVLPEAWEKGLAGIIAWKAMMVSIRFDADSDSFQVLEADDYKTDAGYRIEYKLIEYLSDGDTIVQMIISIENAKDAFILIGSSFSNDGNYLLKNMKSIAENTRINHQR